MFTLQYRVLQRTHRWSKCFHCSSVSVMCLIIEVTTVQIPVMLCFNHSSALTCYKLAFDLLCSADDEYNDMTTMYLLTSSYEESRTFRQSPYIPRLFIYLSDHHLEPGIPMVTLHFALAWLLVTESCGEVYATHYVESLHLLLLIHSISARHPAVRLGNSRRIRSRWIRRVGSRGILRV